ncbi:MULTISPECIES: ABC transporter ATP-binding protein [Pseudomonas]|jgi:peptide/nickel transport system ATP-binding protein|uniref:ABC-type dipeptide transporter n=2 Tax=Pseudomonas syringae TaxID=317 RepID=A0A8T8LQ97_PSESX|nr:MULTISPECIES: ABC transporter ATP-binding protein [Pseudomonas]ALD96549.1 peptide ABC transporter ATP-binding protein [Pseudomonas syringae UMAF0158]KPB30078.1 Oligopeptide/dipeptide ABC transporter [Pseudomonas syringae pv. syringae]KPY29542.1 Oligopeptide/dipeptide ABC transporter, ATP-binding protein [Pseudomonas syringae pv. papulans]KTC06430.1 peptide ABC transporter ATP-binding protein [Pseudomonas sp. ICMP 10191]KWS42626.1 peptide ABC transporter ATP-binding protein [Pseudomonas syri
MSATAHLTENGDGTVLSISDLTVRFAGAPANVVDGVSFSVKRGKTLAIVGESGCGKSVTSMGLMGLLPTTAKVDASDSLLIDEALLGMSEERLLDVRGNRMAMIFQEPMTSLNPVFTIGEQIAESVMRHQGLSDKAARQRALDMLEKVRVPDARQRLDAYPHELSGGMRQRAMIAMALANDPALIIADEPTTALDVTIQAQILSLIANLQTETGTAMILITHDLGVVAEVADDVMVMYAGRVVESGPVKTLFDDPQHPYTIGLMGSMPSIGPREGRLATINGRVPTPAEMPGGCRFAGRCPFVIQRCRDERPPLLELSPGHFAACIRAPLEQHVGVSA